MLKIERIRWLFTLEQDFSYQTKLILPQSYEFYSDRGKVLLRITKTGLITVYQGYSWDGCTPKFKFGSYSIGTYDGYITNGKPATYYASLVHDALYQFLDKLPINRKNADDIFLDLMRTYRYKYVYYIVVRLFGWIFV